MRMNDVRGVVLQKRMVRLQVRGLSSAVQSVWKKAAASTHFAGRGEWQKHLGIDCNIRDHVDATQETH